VGPEPQRLQALARDHRAGHHRAEADVTHQAALERAVADAVSRLGGLDVVVANAGIGSFGTVLRTPIEAQARVIEVNLIGVLRTIAATLPHVIARRGYYLLVSSAAAIAAAPGLAAYGASKSGVEHLGNALRVELADKGVAVGVAHPGWIDTDLVRDAQADLATFGELVRRLPSPLDRTTSCAECADALVAAIERRERKVFVPRSLRLMAALRTLVTSAFGDRQLRRQIGALLPRLEQEAAERGRCFGRTSVETTAAAHTSSERRT
jgi:short-subunit dehydrogenase